MTKNEMVETIKKEERELRHEMKDWKKTCDKYNGGDEDKCQPYQFARARWGSLYRLMEALGIENDYYDDEE